MLKNTGEPMGAFDLRDTIIPFSLLQITNHFRRMAAGEVLEIIGCNDGILSDLKRLLPASEFELTDIRTLGGDTSDFRLRLRKIEAPSHQPEGGTSCQKT